MARDLEITPCEKEPFYFISYNTEDKDVVKEYVKELEKRGIPMWYDGGVRLGDDWEVELVRKIRASEGVIMFLSNNMAQKKDSYVVDEFDTIKRFSNKKIFFVFLDMVDLCALPDEYVPIWRTAIKKQGVPAYEDGLTVSVNKLVKELGHTAFKLNENTDVKKGVSNLKTVMFTRVNGKTDICTEKEHISGLMATGMRANSKKVTVQERVSVYGALQVSLKATCMREIF